MNCFWAAMKSNAHGNHRHDGQRHQKMHVLQATKLGAERIQGHREGRLILRMQIDQGA